MTAERRSLLDLPAELRLEIYAYYFTPDATLPTPPPQTSPLALALTLTCQQLYHETHALAFASTTFRVNVWRLADLRTRLYAVRAHYVPLITRLEVRIGLYEFLHGPPSPYGLQLASAGLAGIEELYIAFVGTREPAFTKNLISIKLWMLLWKTVACCANRRLRKIRIVHSPPVRGFDIVKLGARMRERVEREQRMMLRANRTMNEEDVWQVEDVKEGRCRLVKGGREGQAGREMVLLFGETIREAEMYGEV